MEMQIIFEQNNEKSPSSPFQKYIIISVLFKESPEESIFLKELKINNMPKEPGFKKNIDYPVDLNLLFTKEKGTLGDRFLLESFWM